MQATWKLLLSNGVLQRTTFCLIASHFSFFTIGLFRVAVNLIMKARLSEKLFI